MHSPTSGDLKPFAGLSSMVSNPDRVTQVQNIHDAAGAEYNTSSPMPATSSSESMGAGALSSSSASSHETGAMVKSWSSALKNKSTLGQLP